MSSTESGMNNAEELISMPVSVAVPVMALRGAGAGVVAGAGIGIDIESDSDSEDVGIANGGQLRHQQVRNQALMEAAKRAAQFEENSIRLASGLRDGSNVAQLSWPRGVSDISLSDNSIHFHRQVYGADEDAEQPSRMKVEDLVEFMKQGMKEQDLLEEARKMQAVSASSGATGSLNTKTVLPAVMKALAEKKARMDETQAQRQVAGNDDLKDSHCHSRICINAATVTGVVPSTELSVLRPHQSPPQRCQSLTKSNSRMQSPHSDWQGRQQQPERNSKTVWTADLEMKVTQSVGLELGPGAGKSDKENTQFHPVAVSPSHRDGAAAAAELTDIPDDLRGFRATDGLTAAQVEERRLTYGFNEIVEKKRNPMIKFLLYFTGSIAYLIEAAMILSAVLSDWPDFGIILALLIINALIGFIEEAKAESAVDALLSTLALQTKCVRSTQFVDVPARELVPGDIISIRLGDIIPADAKLLGLNANFESSSTDLLIDQSGLTGESLAVAKHFNDLVYSGTICKQGQMLALVVATGSKTFLGRAAHLISITNESGHFQKVIAHIGNFLIASTLTMVAIVLIVGCTAEGQDFVDQLKFALVLTIASIPVGLPTVMSVTMAVGAKQLAAKRVIVKRLTAVEEMAGVDILCSDKTGTLTLNQLTLDAPYLCGSFTEADLLFYAFLSSESATNDAIESCIRSTAVDKVPMLANTVQQLGGSGDLGDRLYAAIGYKILQFQPFDPTSKMTRATVLDMKNNKVFCVAKGAPQVILKLSDRESPAAIQAAEVAIVNFARSGLRALGVARSADITVAEHEQGDKGERLSWHLIGLLSLLDPPRPDSASTIAACKDYGISVKMVTGDAILIAKEVSRRLGMHRTILSPDQLTNTSISEAEVTHHVEKADGFAQVVPEDKFRVVELLQKRNHLVAMTGDGVNDAPALKKADVGIAVHGCTDAARSAADIVLLEPGLSAIVDGIMTSRQIFQRMRSYAVYRITSTINFLSFLFCTILIWKWALSPTLVVIIALLNDAATLSISVDNALVSKKPDKWRIGQLITLSIILGIMLTGSSFAHFLISKYYFNHSDDFTETVMYLQLSSCGGLVIFSTRLTEPFYKSRPSIIFGSAVLAIQLFSLFISVYGGLSTAIGWPWGITVLCISFGYFCLMDAVKCAVYRYWSFQLTARLWPSKQRRDKLKQKLEHTARVERVEQTVLKIRRAITLVECAMRFKHYKPLPEALIALPKAPHH